MKIVNPKIRFVFQKFHVMELVSRFMTKEHVKDI